MSDASRQFFQTPKGRLVLALAAMLLVWTVILLNFLPETETLLPGAGDLEDLRAELKKEKAEFETQDQKRRAADRLKQEYEARLKEYWQEDTDGDVELGLRELIEQTARNRGVKLASLGSVRTAKINNELCFAELDISLTDTIAGIAGLLDEIRRIKPSISWKRADFRPDMRPAAARQQQDMTRNGGTTAPARARTTNAPEPETPVSDQQLRFTGTIRVICRVSAEDRL